MLDLYETPCGHIIIGRASNPMNTVSVGSNRRGSKQLGCAYGEMFNFI